MPGIVIQRRGGDPWSASVLVMRFAINLGGIFIASRIVPGVHVDDLAALVGVTAIFALVNMLLRPLATLVSCCLVVVTFGLFVLVINTMMFAATAWIAEQLGVGFRVEGWWSAFLGALVVALVSMVASIVVRPPHAGRFE